MSAPDLQTFVAELERRGWLKRIRAAVDPILEITEICDRVVKAGGPALLFENVRGSSLPVLINTFGTRERICLALGADSLDEIAGRVKMLVKPEIPTTLLEKLKKVPQLIQLGSLPPKIVRHGICQEIVRTDDADLTALPALKCWPGDGDLSRNTYAHIREIVRRSHVAQPPPAVGVAQPPSAVNVAQQNSAVNVAQPPAAVNVAQPPSAVRHTLTDANEGSEHARELFDRGGGYSPTDLLPPPNDGRYLTLTNVFTKHPETGERNIGMYRVQILGPKLAAMHWHMHHDGARHYRRYRQLGRRMPIAISFGGPSVMPYAATCPLPPGIDECLFAGFLNGGAIELVPCVSQPGIEVPATAEIVVEGYIDPADPPVIEGPFGDHTGFYSLADLYPRMHITAITHRRSPIYPTTVVGKPIQEDYWLGKATERIFLPLLQTIVPDIIDYNLPTFGCFHNCAFVKIRKEYPYQARRVMSAIWGAGQMAFTKMIVVVDESVDVQDEQAVLFHMLANCDPARDTMVVQGPLDILDHAAPVCGAGSKIGWDATRKWAGEGAIRAWPDELDMTPAIKEQVTRRWRELGL
ncbi:MAG: 3-octaprenyl-4-hydroxybenzoate carboxy-lyase [Phycisphaerae bacterium]|nr:3-octaprenyl-4-hydroxybenzoate carboxy-lyase [Phycisphaerae bacterium]